MQMYQSSHVHILAAIGKTFLVIGHVFRAIIVALAVIFAVIIGFTMRHYHFTFTVITILKVSWHALFLIIFQTSKWILGTKTLIGSLLLLLLAWWRYFDDDLVGELVDAIHVSLGVDAWIQIVLTLIVAYEGWLYTQAYVLLLRI